MSDPLTRTPSERAQIVAALAEGGLIDMTTRGRHTGLVRRIEIVMFDIDGRLFISGLPGPRAWYANLQADPHLTIHLKRHVVADLAGTATLITDPDARRPILERVTAIWNMRPRLEEFVADSPLIEITLDESELLRAA